MPVTFTKGNTLPSTAAEIYGVDILTKVSATVHITSTSTISETMTVWLEIDGTNREISPPSMPLGPGETWISCPQIMKVGDRIIGVCSNASVLTYVVSVEETEL